MHFIVSLISVALGTLIVLGRTGIINLAFLPVEAPLLGAVYLILSQMYFFVRVNTNKSATFMGNIIRIIIVLPAIMYILNKFFSFGFGDYLGILIAAFLFLEGLYGLH